MCLDIESFPLYVQYRPVQYCTGLRQTSSQASSEVMGINMLCMSIIAQRVWSLANWLSAQPSSKRYIYTVINHHLKQLTRHLSSNHINNKNSDWKSGRSGITLLNVAHNFLPIKILTTERESSVQFLSIYHTCHHLKQTKYGIS